MPLRLPTTLRPLPHHRHRLASRLHLHFRNYSKPLTTTTPKMSQQTDSFIAASKTRRTIYALGKNSPVPDSAIKDLVHQAIQHVPSSFNTQSTRLVLMLHDEHEKLWDTVIDTFGALVKTGAVTEEMWREKTLPKLQGMKGGVGTVGFF